MEYLTISDADTAFVNDGWFNAANLDMRDEIVEYMWRNNSTVEKALNELEVWV
mgnify:CR=1 FL=1